MRSRPPFHFTTHLLLVHIPSTMRCCGDFLDSTAIRLPSSPSAQTTRDPGTSPSKPPTPNPAPPCPLCQPCRNQACHPHALGLLVIGDTVQVTRPGESGVTGVTFLICSLLLSHLRSSFSCSSNEAIHAYKAEQLYTEEESAEGHTPAMVSDLDCLLLLYPIRSISSFDFNAQQSQHQPPPAQCQ